MQPSRGKRGHQAPLERFSPPPGPRPRPRDAPSHGHRAAHRHQQRPAACIPGAAAPGGEDDSGGCGRVRTHARTVLPHLLMHAWTHACTHISATGHRRLRMHGRPMHAHIHACAHAHVSARTHARSAPSRSHPARTQALTTLQLKRTYDMFAADVGQRPPVHSAQDEGCVPACLPACCGAHARAHTTAHAHARSKASQFPPPLLPNQPLPNNADACRAQAAAQNGAEAARRVLQRHAPGCARRSPTGRARQVAAAWMGSDVDGAGCGLPWPLAHTLGCQPVSDNQWRAAAAGPRAQTSVIHLHTCTSLAH